MSSSESNSSFELPSMPEQHEQGVSIEAPLASSPEAYTSPVPVMPAKPIPIDPTLQATPVTIPNDGNTVNSQGSPVIADDTDLIEKEWVVKAKQIVAATKDDPYKQNSEMSKFKADYLKKRYGKNIKVEEG